MHVLVIHPAVIHGSAVPMAAMGIVGVVAMHHVGFRRRLRGRRLVGMVLMAVMLV